MSKTTEGSRDEPAQAPLGDRTPEAESAQAYADAGIAGAPGSEVRWPETAGQPEDEGDGTDDG